MKTPACFEIVGPPGAGKSTLVRALLGRSSRIRLIDPPQWREIRDLPFFVRSGLATGPVLASFLFRKARRRPSRDEYNWLMFLDGGYRRLADPGRAGIVSLLDQGPVYMLSALLYFRDTEIDRPVFRRWLNKVLTAWRLRLDGIVWLNAAAPFLAGRINSRVQDHIIKGATEPRIRDFVAERRAALERAVAMMSAGPDAPAVLRFDTGRQSPQEIAARIIAEWGLAGR